MMAKVSLIVVVHFAAVVAVVTAVRARKDRLALLVMQAPHVVAKVSN